jgi:hypothetical protein
MRNLTNAQLAELLDKDIFHKISHAADSLGMECYVVGGYVRDLFLERPSNDIDVVVVGSGIQVATALKGILAKTARANIEEVHIGIFYIFDEWGLVYIVTIPFPNILKVLHAVRYALAIDSLSSFSYSHALNVF